MEPDNARLSGCNQQSSAAKFPPKTMVDWNSLPFIVQNLIWEELANKYHCDSPGDRKNRAAFAAVSSEWQDFFESRSFGKLVLHPSALDAFEKIIQRRQNNDPVKKVDCVQAKRRQKKPAGEAPSPAASRMPRIKHIWLRIELLQYDCRRCMVPESGKEIVRCVCRLTLLVYAITDFYP